MSFKIDFENIIKDGNITDDEWDLIIQNHKKTLKGDGVEELRAASQDYLIAKSEITNKNLVGAFWASGSKNLNFQHERAVYLQGQLANLSGDDKVAAKTFITEEISRCIHLFGANFFGSTASEDRFQNSRSQFKKIYDLMPRQARSALDSGETQEFLHWVDSVGLEPDAKTQFLVGVIFEHRFHEGKIEFFVDLTLQQRQAIYQHIKPSLDSQEAMGLLFFDVLWLENALPVEFRDEVLDTLNWNSKHISDLDLENLKLWTQSFGLNDIPEPSILWTLSKISQHGWTVLPGRSVSEEQKFEDLYPKKRVLHRVIQLQLHDDPKISALAKKVDQQLKSENLAIYVEAVTHQNKLPYH